MFNLKIDSSAKKATIEFDFDITQNLDSLERWLKDGMSDAQAQHLFKANVLSVGAQSLRAQIDCACRTDEERAAELKAVQDRHAAEKASAPKLDVGANIAAVKAKVDAEKKAEEDAKKKAAEEAAEEA